jgi:hypothetical protein
MPNLNFLSYICARVTDKMLKIIFVIFRYSDLYYKRIGKITLYSNGGLLVKYFDSEKLLWISALVINYGGYDGEPKALDVFFTGSGFRDGTRNLFIIYSNQLQKGEKPLRVLIKSKQQAVDLKLIANELAENGVTIDIKKSHWMRIPF